MLSVSSSKLSNMNNQEKESSKEEKGQNEIVFAFIWLAVCPLSLQKIKNKVRYSNKQFANIL